MKKNSSCSQSPKRNKKAQRGLTGRIVAVARKLAVLLHRLWVTGEVYEPLRNNTAGPHRYRWPAPMGTRP